LLRQDGAVLLWGARLVVVVMDHIASTLCLIGACAAPVWCRGGFTLWRGPAGHLDRTPIVKSPVRPAPSATTGDTYLMYVPLLCGDADRDGKPDTFGLVRFCPVLSGS
jgi:hypothetical protein